MPQVLLEATDAQLVRLQAARVVYNAQNGTNLSLIRFLYAILGTAVETYLAAEVNAAALAARDTALNAIKSDMAGGT